MNKYETVMIINSSITEEERSNIISKILDLIEANGTIISDEDCGLRNFAYEIRGKSQGYYYQICFESESGFIRELEREYRITDPILKFIVVRQDD